MGKFDTVICKYPLPDSPPEDIQNADFQTCDLDDQLNWYEITKDGRLVLIDRAEDSNIKQEEIKSFTGTIRLYDYRDRIFFEIRTKYQREGLNADTYMTAAERNSYWIQYTATFENGTLKNITRDLANYPDPAIPSREERERITHASSDSGIILIDEAGSIPIR